GIELGRAPERACRLLVNECVDQLDALVEISLRLGIARRHRMMEIAETRHQRAWEGSDGAGAYRPKREHRRDNQSESLFHGDAILSIGQGSGKYAYDGTG